MSRENSVFRPSKKGPRPQKRPTCPRCGVVIPTPVSVAELVCVCGCGTRLRVRQSATDPERLTVTEAQ